MAGRCGAWDEYSLRRYPVGRWQAEGFHPDRSLFQGRILGFMPLKCPFAPHLFARPFHSISSIAAHLLAAFCMGSYALDSLAYHNGGWGGAFALADP